MTVLRPAKPEDYPLVREMSHPYMKTLAAWVPWIERDGFLDAPDSKGFFKRFFEEPHRQAFLIVSGSKPAGFALIDRTESGYSISQFYVDAAHRKQALGAAAARELFDMFRGAWEIMVIAQNPAVVFWRKVVSVYTGGNFGEEAKILERFGGREEKVIFTLRS